MSGLGGLVKTGEGVFTLSGSNSFLGDSFINAGTLVLNSTTALATDAIVTMNNASTLTVNQRTVIGYLEQNSGTVNGPGQLISSLILTESGVLNSVIANGADYAVGLLKRTDGTTTVSAANTFTGSVRIQGGTMQLVDGGSFAAGSSLVMSAGTIDLNNKSQAFTALNGLGGTVALGAGELTISNVTTSVFDGAITGTGGVVKRGLGRLELGGTSSYTGATIVEAGELKVNGSIAGSAVSLAAGSSLSGSGSVGVISGAGSVDPGNSPGILTAPAVDPSGGLSFNFEFTALNPVFTDASASLNDVLRLTDPTAPFVGALASANVVNIYFNVDAVQPSEFYRGAFFTDRKQGFDSLIVDAQFNYYIKDDTGPVSYGGQSYALMGGGFSIVVSTVSQGADFGSGLVDGQITQFEVIPEPSTYALLVLGAAAFGFHAWRRRRRA
jgi:autotransporter-associated beta strand protein